jgi:hypothetical protein
MDVSELRYAAAVVEDIARRQEHLTVKDLRNVARVLRAALAELEPETESIVVGTGDRYGDDRRDLRPVGWNGPVDRPLVDDLAHVLISTCVGWADVIGHDLTEAPEVKRVLARYRQTRDNESYERQAE